MNKDIVGAIFPEAVANVEAGRCATCGIEMKDQKFRDALSQKEFEISGMCQVCQDETFGK